MKIRILTFALITAFLPALCRAQSTLDDIFKNRNERIVFVKGDDALEFNTVAQVIDIAKGVGIDKIGLVTESLQEGQ